MVKIKFHNAPQRRSYIGWTVDLPQMIMALHIKAAETDLLYVWIFGEILHGTLLADAGFTGRGKCCETTCRLKRHSIGRVWRTTEDLPHQSAQGLAVSTNFSMN
jgi:hypothetical protein